MPINEPEWNEEHGITDDGTNVWLNVGKMRGAWTKPHIVTYPSGERTQVPVLSGVFCSTPSAHQEYWEQRNNYLVYEYDPTDDGPEVEIITRILAADWYYQIDSERAN